MTRINLIPVEELSDQHLLAEYKELPRCIKQDINIKDSPTNYCLGKGHMKWARNHLTFLLERYKIICSEMVYRGFTMHMIIVLVVCLMVIFQRIQISYYQEIELLKN